MAEVKRAYRRLAKAYHPDSAGEAALSRFLAIHEAYERLVTGRSRAGGGPRGSRAASTPQPSAEPWRADPERARAARERARTGRGWGSTTGSAGGRAGAQGGRGSTSRTGTSGGGPSSSGTGASAASAASGAAGSARSGAREGRRRNVRKATLGSTSYDEARDHTDATWSGASWYGPSSGEYWIVNPREYADPRKHGPGYQQRARQAPAGATGIGEIELDEESRAPEAPTSPGGRAEAFARSGTKRRNAAPAPEASAAAGTREASRRRATPRADWAATSDEGATAPGPPRRQRGAATWPGDGPPRDPIQSIGAAGRELLGGSPDDPIRRLGLALVAWPPIGLAAAAAIGDITGCTTYSADCAGSDSLLPWLAQAAILGLLLLLPPLARLFVGGTVAVLLALVPVTAVLLVLGGGGAPQSAFALAILLAGAWIGGVAWAARGAARSVA